MITNNISKPKNYHTLAKNLTRKQVYLNYFFAAHKKLVVYKPSKNKLVIYKPVDKNLIIYKPIDIQISTNKLKDINYMNSVEVNTAYLRKIFYFLY